jgi:flagellar protein FlaJ
MAFFMRGSEVMFNRLQRAFVWCASIFAIVVAFLLILESGSYSPKEPYIIPLDSSINTLLGFSVLLGLISPSIMEYMNIKWKRQIEGNIPIFMRDLTEYVRSGITLSRGIREVSKRNYGPLTRELIDVVNRIELGETLESSMTRLAARIKLPQVTRMSTILVEANRSGGRIVEVLQASSELFSELENYKRKRYTQMKPYSLLVYMAVLTFLMVSYVVLSQFLGPLYASSASDPSSIFLGGLLDLRYYRSMLFWASLIESIFGGLLAGKLSEGSFLAGTRHSVILLSVTLIFFTFLGV